MGANIIAPKMGQSITDKGGGPTQRLQRFFVSISEYIKNDPNVVSPVADVSVSSADPDIEALEAKINELLGALRTSGVMES